MAGAAGECAGFATSATEDGAVLGVESRGVFSERASEGANGEREAGW